jgi:SOS-response transcriptional repressor LexA
VNVKGLILWELDEGMTEEELASAIHVPLRTLNDILAGNFPQDSDSWEKLARYFRMDVDVLQAGGSTHSIVLLTLSDRTLQSAAGLIRRIPLLDWDQMGQMVTNENIPDVIHANAMLDTAELSGERTVALRVRDDSMETMFSQGEIILVDPNSKWKPGDYAIVYRPGGHPETILLRQVKSIGSQSMLHPLNQKYEDFPLTKQDKVWGKVIQVAKNL